MLGIEPGTFCISLSRGLCHSELPDFKVVLEEAVRAGSTGISPSRWKTTLVQWRLRPFCPWIFHHPHNIYQEPFSPQVNGQLAQLPVTTSQNVTISSSQDGVVIDLASQVSVLLKPCGEMIVHVNESLEGKLCASCGNFNGNRTDDLKLPDGKEAGNIAEVIDAWEAKDFSNW